MVRVIRQSLLLGAGMLTISAPALLAQADSKAAPTVEAERPETTDSAPVKKKGLFGKVKDAASSKVAKTVAKTAACTIVPGGQFIAGAIDAADSETAGEAVGAGCMPRGIGAGMGAAGPGPGGLGAGGLTGMAAEAATSAALSGHASEPEGAAPLGYGSLDGMPDQGQIAGCMGLTAEEYEALTNPTGGEARQLTKAEMKRQQQLSKKVDMRRYQSCMMQAASGGR